MLQAYILQSDGFRIAVDGEGRAYVAGGTQSVDFPALNAYSAVFGGAGSVFVSKFRGGGCCVGIRGKVDGDGLDRINLADITYLIGFIFRTTPAPPCSEEADVTGDGQIMLSDVTLLISHVFRGGPAPAACP